MVSRLLCFLLLAAPVLADDKDPKALVAKMIETVGGLDGLYAKQDVVYTYTYAKPNENYADVSTESYIFDGELSHAVYTRGDGFANVNGQVIQGFDGQSTWVTIDGQPAKDEALIKQSDFLRKTNYYWFAMMFKLLDPGLTYSYEGTRSLEGIEYNLVRVGFADGIGDAQDTYLLYINPYTHLVDQFLFTVMDFGLKDPLLMKVDYVTVDGLVLPASRRYTRSNWDGSVAEDAAWVLEIMSDIRFNNGLDRKIFKMK